MIFRSLFILKKIDKSSTSEPVEYAILSTDCLLNIQMSLHYFSLWNVRNNYQTMLYLNKCYLIYGNGSQILNQSNIFAFQVKYISIF